MACSLLRGSIVRRLVTGIALAVSMLAMPAAQASTTSWHGRFGSEPDYYLALGDSLSVGIPSWPSGCPAARARRAESGAAHSPDRIGEP
jgi:hypothetical protein